jgi:hypothetical protein
MNSLNIDLIIQNTINDIIDNIDKHQHNDNNSVTSSNTIDEISNTNIIDDLSDDITNYINSEVIYSDYTSNFDLIENNDENIFSIFLPNFDLIENNDEDDENIFSIFLPNFDLIENNDENDDIDSDLYLSDNNNSGSIFNIDELNNFITNQYFFDTIINNNIENIYNFNNNINIIITYNNYSFNLHDDNLPIIHDNDETKEWKCTECGIINRINDTCCNKPYLWKCNICDNKNESHLIKCEECSNIHTWTCDSCDNSNLITTHICTHCLNENNNLTKWTCCECNETNELLSRFRCSSCNEKRVCQCNECISNIMYIPYTLSDLLDSDIDYTELEDVEINNGLTENDLQKLEKIKWTNDNESSLCSICIQNYEINDELYILPCNKIHTFHIDCLNKWFKKNNTCPICRFLI